MAGPVVVVTGFEPFGDHAVNPSEGLAKAVDGRRLGDTMVRGLVLPVHHAGVAALITGALDELQPAAIVHLGLAAGRARMAVERLAVNVVDYSVPDNRGVQPRGGSCVAEGPAAYLSTLPLVAITRAMQAEGVPAYISDSAGTYVCNQTLYGTLHAIARSGRRTRAGLIHVPLLPAMVAASGADALSMDFSVMLRGLDAALGVLAADPSPIPA
jgi:pyroglutamyl-peptidase